MQHNQWLWIEHRVLALGQQSSATRAAVGPVQKINTQP